MKNTASSRISLAGALALSVVVFGQASEPAAPDASPSANHDRPALRGPKALGPFSLFDVDHDGALSAEEIANSAAVLRKLDKNHDGRITADELRGGRQRPPEGEL